MPPVAPGAIPWVRSGIGLLRNPTAFFASNRARLGDTFFVEAYGYRMFCVFSPMGVKALYDLPEDQASFGLATYRLVFENKLPLELVGGRRNRPHDLFGSEDVERYLDVLEAAVAVELRELGDQGRFEIFAECHRLGHRMGLAAWAGEEAAAPESLAGLMPLFDRLDSAASFVRPIELFRTRLTNKAAERRALAGIERRIAEILRTRSQRGETRDDFLAQIERSFADVPRERRSLEVARDVILIHLGAQSNLPAALAWTLVNLLLRPELLERVRAGDDAMLEQCANESIRLAQRSLTLREVVRPIEIEDEKQRYRLTPGVLVATMLSVSNHSSGPDLDRFDPDHYAGRRLAPDIPIDGRERVSTFGHGRHSCPAQRFSISAIRIALRKLLDRFDLAPRFESATPRHRQLGGVARAQRACLVDYSRRT